MKLIIDIRENIYKARQHWVANPKRMVDEVDIAIANGTPLDKIRAEIEQIADEEQKHDKKWAIGLRYAVKIIDKYRGEQP